METIIMDGIEIYEDDNALCLCNEDSEFWGEYNKQSNIATKMYYALYQAGRLSDLCVYLTEHHKPNNDGRPVLYIDFVIDASKLKQDFIKEMETLYPGNGLMTLDQRSVSHYIPCTGLAYMPYSTYRGQECIGRSYEHPYLHNLRDSAVYELGETARTKGTVRACVDCIKLVNGEE